MEDPTFESIPEEKWVPEIEERVRYFMQTTGSSKENRIEYKRIKMPKFNDELDKELWGLDQIRKCKDGFNNMTPKMYFYFNFCNIIAISGMIPPEYRVADQEWFRTIEEAQASKKWGVICVKRRRVGASWKEAADVLHDCLFNTHFRIGMNSMSEKDSIELFKKVKFVYDNLPTFLRPTTSGGNTKYSMDFSFRIKDENGNRVKRGNQSNITVVAPTDSAYEGLMLNKWVADEAGKCSNLESLWAYTEPCLMEQTKRSGMPILFGTSGEVGKEGAALASMWNASDAYNLRKFFFSGWMGLSVDRYGNDRKEDCIRWILYTREQMKLRGANAFHDFIQQYPLTPAEAFMLSTGAGIGDIIKINEQIRNLADNPPLTKRGKFVLTADENVKFIPDGIGDVIIYEHPEEGKDNQYLAGCDPVDHDDEEDYNGFKKSSISLFIRKKASGTSAPYAVMEYYGRPRRKADGYEQVILALMYYGNTKVLIERNRYRMISHFEERGLKHLLQRAPQGVMRLIGGKINTIGVTMTEHFRNYIKSLTEAEIDDNWLNIPSKEYLEECAYFGMKNTDRVFSYGLTLALEKEDRTKITESIKVSKINPSFRFIKRSGNIVRVNI